MGGALTRWPNGRAAPEIHNCIFIIPVGFIKKFLKLCNNTHFWSTTTVALFIYKKMFNKKLQYCSPLQVADVYYRICKQSEYATITGNYWSQISLDFEQRIFVAFLSPTNSCSAHRSRWIDIYINSVESIFTLIYIALACHRTQRVRLEQISAMSMLSKRSIGPPYLHDFHVLGRCADKIVSSRVRWNV